MENKIKCSKCASESIKKNGKRKTQNRGFIQRFKCNSCSHRFVANNGFKRMRNNPQKITLCLDLFYRGVSTRKVQEHLQTFYPHNSDHSTILRWIWRYTKQISTFTNKLKLRLGEEIQVDEVEYRRRKNYNNKGVEDNWLIDSIDPQTKFMVSSEYSKSRSQKKIISVIRQAKERSESQIKIVTTDGFTAYESAIKKVFGYNNKLKRYDVFHNRTVVSDGDSFNYPIERLHNSLRARTKVFRGFHGSLRSASLILKGYEIYYNFITKHQAINKCPYELAIPELKEKLTMPNKWLSLIEMANQRF